MNAALTSLLMVALAAKYSDAPLFILMGTTGGMLVADALCGCEPMEEWELPGAKR